MAIAMLLVFFGVSVKKEDAKEMAGQANKFDALGTLGLMVFLGCLIVALSMTSIIPLGSMTSNIILVVAAVGLIVLIVDIRNKGDKAIVPAKVFRERNAVLVAICVALMMITSMAISIFMPQFIPALAADPVIQAIDPQTKGLALTLPTAFISIAGLFMGPVFGKMIAKVSNVRTVTTIATIVQICVFAVLAVLLFVCKDANGNPNIPYIAILVLMFIAGIPNSRNSVVPASAQIQISPEVRQQAHSIVQVGQNLGGGLSMPIFGIIQATFAAPLIAQGMAANAAGVAALPQAFPVVIILVLILSIPLLILGLMLKPLKKEETQA
jgi:MFS family permease